MITLEIKLDKELFQFSSVDDWTETAHDKFAAALKKENLLSQNIILIDTDGRVCAYGLHFRRAEEEKTFPVIGYKIV